MSSASRGKVNPCNRACSVARAFCTAAMCLLNDCNTAVFLSVPMQVLVVVTLQTTAHEYHQRTPYNEMGTHRWTHDGADPMSRVLAVVG